MSSIFDWSTTPANNASSDSGMTWAEGQAPSTVNNSARQLVARVAEIIGDIGGTGTVGGTANGITLTPSSNVTALADGLFVAFKATDSITGAATLNYNGLGSKALRKMTSSGDAALIANEIRDGGIYFLHYSAAADGGSGAWLVLNPSLSEALYALAGLTTVDNTVPRFDGTSGKLQTSGVTIDDDDVLVAKRGVFSGGNGVLVVGTTSAFNAATGLNLYYETDSGIATISPVSPSGSTSLVFGTSNGGSYSAKMTISAAGAISIAGSITTTGDINSGDDFNAGSYSGTGASAGAFIGNDGVINLSSTGTGSHQKAGFVNGNGGVGSIVTSGSGTTYNTASDGRKKKNFRPFDAGAILDQLEFGQYEWISDDSTGYGVIAQDALKIFPQAITINPDGWHEADYSKFVPLIGSEIKKLRHRVAVLEAQSSNH